MNKRINLIAKLPRSKKLILAASTGLVVLSTSSVLAFNGLLSTGASDAPVDVEVEDHDKRITKNEQDIAETKDRVGQVEEKTESNTQAIGAVERKVIVVQGQANATAGQVQQMQTAGSAPAEAPTAQAEPVPQVAPAPPVNKRLIVASSGTPQTDRFGKPMGWNCNYELPGQRIIMVFQPTQCSAAGTEIAEDVAISNGVPR